PARVQQRDERVRAVGIALEAVLAPHDAARVERSVVAEVHERSSTICSYDPLWPAGSTSSERTIPACAAPAGTRNRTRTARSSTGTPPHPTPRAAGQIRSPGEGRRRLTIPVASPRE